jgi:hypothetical protein
MFISEQMVQAQNVATEINPEMCDFMLDVAVQFAPITFYKTGIASQYAPELLRWNDVLNLMLFV